jgi:hypothetical protein
MGTKEETSLTRAADPAFVLMGDTLVTSSGSVALNGLENGVAMGESIPNPDYCSSPAEAMDGAPVASGLDSTPTNWFELAADLCASGHITETRMRRAIEAVRRGVSRE